MALSALQASHKDFTRALLGEGRRLLAKNSHLVEDGVRSPSLLLNPKPNPEITKRPKQYPVFIPRNRKTPS
jgi:hypothetical protein